MRLLGSLLLLVFCFALVPQKVIAQAGAPAATPAAAPTTPATQTTQYTLPPDKLAKSKALYDLRSKLRIIDTVWSFVVLLGILYLGIGARYRDWAEKVARNSFVQAWVFIPLFLLTTSILGLPLDA
ncbi:MAG: M48 family metallopeptidase, partial [Candidatus Angelobacter sp.]